MPRYLLDYSLVYRYREIVIAEDTLDAVAHVPIVALEKGADSWIVELPPVLQIGPSGQLTNKKDPAALPGGPKKG